MAQGRNNARRRRVILDEAVQQASAEQTPGTEDKSSNKPGVDLANAYSDAAKRRGQLKTTDLIPKRSLPVGIVIGIVLIVFTIINLLSFYGPNWNALSEDAVRSLGLTGVGTISAWFSSLLLLVSGMASLQIYGMRKHRCDDYSGHYRVWLFLAVLFLVASVNCVVDFNSIASSLARYCGFGGGNGLIVLLLAKMVALTALVVRGILEIRASKAAFATVVIVWIAYASAIVSQIPGLNSELVQGNDIVYGNLVIVGNICLFLTVMFYSRFVYLHANELIKLEYVKKESTAAKSKTIATKSQITKTEKESTNNQPGVPKQKLTADTSEKESNESILQLPLGNKLKKVAKKQNRKSQKQSRKAA